ncbi:MAG: glycosyltransferase family 39 protein [Candidatus Krumholzibacteriota bacterium]|nr:glycosyltransferase family 39 protein [Candidatus Krumholzibacteriota bacterium]
MKRLFLEKNIPVLFIVLISGTVFRFLGLGWALPEIYEEATPLIKAWEMWGWGTGRTPDLNPHFFNYPGLMIYLHFAVQGILFLSMKISGIISSTAHFQAAYIIDKTLFYYAGRAVGALFGVATIAAVFHAGRILAGRTAGIISAILLALNTFHISKSQLIEVDIPLTFFITASLILMTRLLKSDSFRVRIITGIFTGLAISTKYTAALLFIPLLAVHAAAFFDKSEDRAAIGSKHQSVSSIIRSLLLVSATAIAVFIITSPYTVLDWPEFWKDISLERQHMQSGHFGLESTSSLRFYAGSLPGLLPGWPLLFLSISAIFYFAVRIRDKNSIIFASFALPYLLVISSWSMKADRYLLPVLPLLLIFASAAIAGTYRYIFTARLSRLIRFSTLSVLSFLIAFPIAASCPEHIQKYRPDNRTIAKEWIRENIPSGSFIVTEAYGPEFIKPQVIAAQPEKVRKMILERIGGRVDYALLPIPMFQSVSERSESFYDLSLYRMADIIITSSSVCSRYMKDPARYSKQNAFYVALARDYDIVFKSAEDASSGPVLTIFRSTRHHREFSRRKEIEFPSLLSLSGDLATGSEELFYLDLGLNYEAFGYYRQAIASYQLAFNFPVVRSSSYNSLILGMTRCLLATHSPEKAVELLEEAETAAPDQRSKDSFRRLRERIRPDRRF